MAQPTARPAAPVRPDTTRTEPPARVQRTRPRTKGTPGIPAGAIYVGRARGNYGRWGNPWYAGDYGRAGAAHRFREYLEARRAALPGWVDAIGYPSDEEIRAELAGRDLACWCPIPARGQPDHCHAAVLLELANTPAGGAA